MLSGIGIKGKSKTKLSRRDLERRENGRKSQFPGVVIISSPIVLDINSGEESILRGKNQYTLFGRLGELRISVSRLK